MCSGRGGYVNHRGDRNRDHGRAPETKRTLGRGMLRKDGCDFHPSGCVVGLMSWVRDFEMRLPSARAAAVVVRSGKFSLVLLRDADHGHGQSISHNSQQHLLKHYLPCLPAKLLLIYLSCPSNIFLRFRSVFVCRLRQ